MNVLKSLDEFRQEATCLDSSQLKQINGGLIKRWTVKTNEGGCADKAGMMQEWRVNPNSGKYEPYRLAVIETWCYEDASCEPK